MKLHIYFKRFKPSHSTECMRVLHAYFSLNWHLSALNGFKFDIYNWSRTKLLLHVAKEEGNAMRDAEDLLVLSDYL